MQLISCKLWIILLSLFKTRFYIFCRLICFTSLVRLRILCMPLIRFFIILVTWLKWDGLSFFWIIFYIYIYVLYRLTRLFTVSQLMLWAGTVIPVKFVSWYEAVWFGNTGPRNWKWSISVARSYTKSLFATECTVRALCHLTPYCCFLISSSFWCCNHADFHAVCWCWSSTEVGLYCTA